MAPVKLGSCLGECLERINFVDWSLNVPNPSTLAQEEEADFTEYYKQVGKKHDQGKPRLSMVHGSLLRACARALEHGLDKYSVQEDNWKYVDNARPRYLDALLRHLHRYADGVEIDPDSGLHELDCIAANVMFLCYFKEVADEDSSNGR